MGLIQMAPGAERPEHQAMADDPLYGKCFHHVRAEANAAAVRLRDGTDLGAIPLEHVEERMASEVASRS